MMSSGGLGATDEVLIVGGGLAGIRSAQSLRRAGFGGRVTLVSDEGIAPYDRPPLSKQVLSGKWDLDRLSLADDATYDELNIDLVLGNAAQAMDLEAGELELADGTSLKADALIVASGCRARPLPGTAGMGAVHLLRTGRDALDLREALGARDSQRVLVIGSGFIGAEVASEAASRGHQVTVLELESSCFARILPGPLGDMLGGLHARGAVALRCGVQVSSIEELPDGTLAVQLTNGEQLAADLLVVGIGVIPNTEWLEGSGLDLSNGLVVDESLFATDAVMAVGDVANFTWTRHGRSDQVRIEHWTVANDHASHAGPALLAGREKADPLNLIPYFWSDQYGVKIQVLGHPSPSDEFHLQAGSLEEGKALLLLGQGDQLNAVLALSQPRQLMAYRPLLESGASLSEALAFELS
jgi:3-phenylpropionate/trans-cinnamate dioxygenase ferredoxin reductase subunit